VLHQGADIVPVMGARTRKQLQETIRALELKLSAEELRKIGEAVPAEKVAGQDMTSGKWPCSIASGRQRRDRKATHDAPQEHNS
jgi:diketogulonate reductase-like aldo/keto reductase